MRGTLKIPIHELFVIALILKIGFSAVGWAIDDPWFFGFTLPLLVMMGYIAVGIRRRQREVSDEKFADSCYYLGFIFTITSIIFCLFDLPNIGAHMALIAIRFGAAMISTVLGLGVRVYLVSFQADFDDAVRSAEERLIEAYEQLHVRAIDSYDKLAEFETKVDAAAVASLAKVEAGVAQMTQVYSETMTGFFTEATERNHAVFQASLIEVRQASLNLAKSADLYSGAMQTSLTNLENKIAEFGAAVSNQLAQTRFPDDYFAERLASPLATLGNSTVAIASQVELAAGSVGQATNAMCASLATLQARSTDMEGAVDRVATLTANQNALLTGAQAQVDILTGLVNTVRAAQEGMSGLSTQIAAQAGALVQNANVAATQTATMSTIATSLQQLEKALRSRPHDEDLAQKLALTQQESATINQGVSHLSAQLSGLTQDLHAFVRETAALTQRLGAMKTGAQPGETIR